ncbi:hypothetical protein GUJ93_ZPchr0010g8678 [Zizania palustris]|uniref:Secreted protein n=1 Tax=Zizania palustris TaxID=103762 RepID=A0A8J5W7S8_ZIZPA|nr:hypothetical protein GUJ93_ZPchr0010g8678 [Zizania palustris]
MCSQLPRTFGRLVVWVHHAAALLPCTRCRPNPVERPVTLRTVHVIPTEDCIDYSPRLLRQVVERLAVQHPAPHPPGYNGCVPRAWLQRLLHALRLGPQARPPVKHRPGKNQAMDSEKKR